MESEIHVSQSGVELGAFDEATILQKIANGELRRDDSGWREGMEEWKPLGELMDIPDSQAVFQAVNPHLSTPQTEKKSSKRKLVFAVAILTVLIILGVLFLVPLKSFSGSVFATTEGGDTVKFSGTPVLLVPASKMGEIVELKKKYEAAEKVYHDAVHSSEKEEDQRRTDREDALQKVRNDESREKKSIETALEIVKTNQETNLELKKKALRDATWASEMQIADFRGSSDKMTTNALQQHLALAKQKMEIINKFASDDFENILTKYGNDLTALKKKYEIERQQIDAKYADASTSEDNFKSLSDVKNKARSNLISQIEKDGLVETKSDADGRFQMSGNLFHSYIVFSIAERSTVESVGGTPYPVKRIYIFARPADDGLFSSANNQLDNNNFFLN